MKIFKITLYLSLTLFAAPSAFGQGAESSESAAVNPVHRTVERAIGYLQAQSADWLKTRKCAACHHVPLPLWALSEASKQGYQVDTSFVAQTTEQILGSRDKLMASKILPIPGDTSDPRPQSRGLNMGLPLMSVAAQSMPTLPENQKETVKLIAEAIVDKQQPDGSWEFFTTLERPPMNESAVTDAVWIILALSGDDRAEFPEGIANARSKAIDWYRHAPRSGSHQDKVLNLLLGTRLNMPREAMQQTIDELVALQRSDGGWSQTIPEPVSDAYATGQSLYVLALMGHSANEPFIGRGIDFLVATQSEEGTWPMVPRTGPEGSPKPSKFLSPIQCAASSWATLGLSRLVGKR